MSTKKKKLIEVALPLEAINAESAREKSIRHGHPSTLHLWWARRPLASCRAVLFASLVDDPSARLEEFPTAAAQEKERRRLMEMIERLVKWENINDAKLMAEAHAEILKSTGGNPPPILDPFCGGGSIPLEVQRLGLEAHASDINPVAVLITKALIEIPPRFKDLPPVNPVALEKAKISSWTGAQGLAEDVRYYGQWVRDEAQQRIGHLYPKVTLSDRETEATVIAWLWARTVKCPNPACGCQMPLVKSFELSTKKGKETWVEPVIDRSKKTPTIKFEIRNGTGNPLKDGTVGRRGATCLACGTPTTLDHVRSEGKAQRMGAQLMTIVAEGKRGRIYVSPNAEHEKTARKAKPEWKPELSLPLNNPRNFNTLIYGLTSFADLFTDRQLVALTTLSDLVQHDVQAVIKQDALSAGLADDDIPLREGGTGARAYVDAVVTYLGLGVSKLSDAQTSLTRWKPSMDQSIATFARQAIPMVWDFAESNTFNNAAGDYSTTLSTIVRAINNLGKGSPGSVRQQDATTFVRSQNEPALVFTTDPPYYDNISYAELSDFFYVWLRRSLGKTYPELFNTLATPKDQELVAAPYRFGGDKEKARQFFEEGLQKAFQQTYKASHPDYPFSVFYAFKQTETEESADGKVTASTGWETMLEGLIRAGFSITGTWPMRTELSNRTVASGSNALASSIVLVCRPLPKDATKATRRQFLNALQRELPAALQAMQQGNIAPVDLAQASIGPGMAVFTRYAEILEPNGDRMTVRTALQLINQTLDDFLSEQEGVFDADTRWALTWYEQHQFEPGAYGDAETLSKAKVTSIQGLVNSGILAAKAGKVHLLKRSELPTNWTPDGDDRIPDWEAMQHLILHLQTHGEAAAAELLAQLGNQGDITRDLAYRLYNICDRNGWTQDAIAYNSLVTSWSEISRLAAQSRDQAQSEPKQLALV